MRLSKRHVTPLLFSHSTTISNTSREIRQTSQTSLIKHQMGIQFESQALRERFRRLSRPLPSRPRPASAPGTANLVNGLTPALSLITAPIISPILPFTQPASVSASGIPGTITGYYLTPAPCLTPTPVGKPTSSGNQTLWQKALDNIPAKDKEGIDFLTDGLLPSLIHATEQKKKELQEKQWVYQNSRGQTVSYADKFLTLLNKYARIVDIAIQHDPHVVALVWAGIRFLLLVNNGDLILDFSH